MAGIDEVARRTAWETGFSIPMCKWILSAGLYSIGEICDEGTRIVIRGFGTFNNRTTPARIGTDPKTHEHITIPSRTKMVFKRSRNVA